MEQKYSQSLLQLKALEKGEFEGYGSVFGNKDLGGDIVQKGAFEASLREYAMKGTMPAMLWQHKPDRVPGKWLAMEEHDRGLAVKGMLADTVLGKEIGTLLKMKAVTGLSFGYRATDIDRRSDGVRLINEAILFEVSVVSVPMNQEARVELVKSLASDNRRVLETTLRDAGLSRNTAKTVVACAFDLRDAVEDDELAALKNLIGGIENAVLTTAMEKIR